MRRRGSSTNNSARFTPLSGEDELWMINNDTPGLPRTKEYLDELILVTLDSFELTPARAEKLHQSLRDDMEKLASILMADHEESIEHKFGMCFIWYMVRYICALPNTKMKRAA